MSDISRYLPLSSKPERDESAVTSNWSRHFGSALLQLVELLEELTPEQWEAPSVRHGWSVRASAGALLWQIGTPARARASARLRRALRDRVSLRASDDALGRDAATRDTATRDTAELAAALRKLAVASIMATSKRSVSELSQVVVTAYDIATGLGIELTIDSVATGAVALARSLKAPLRIRSVLGIRRLVATDADWSVGRGTELPGSAAAIVLFLFGRRGLPPEATANTI